MAQFLVNTLGLNLRSTPDSSNRHNILAVLSSGHEVVEETHPDNREPWKHVVTRVSGVEVRGFVHAEFLIPRTTALSVPVHRELAAVHLREEDRSITRRSGSRAFPLGESNRPRRKRGGSEAALASLHELVSWLDVERSERYKPGNNFTYCNIYAHDFCYLAGVYLPRVWWTDQALCKLWHRKPSEVIYGGTVTELNANSLFDWLAEFGPDFGWSRVFSPEAIQSDANGGKVAVICAKRKNINYSGHICAVLPESGTRKAKRTDGSVTGPLQSQAGASNKKYFTDVWWTHARYREFAFWVHT